MQPRYPIYIPSKGRHDIEPSWSTVHALSKDGVPFHLVVEPQEEDAYRAAFPTADLLVMPEETHARSAVPARNFSRDHSVAAGAKRHWTLDDNMGRFTRLYKGKRVPCHAGTALRCVEDFTDRYTNIGIAGLSYEMFAPSTTKTPFILNCHVYSCALIWNEMPYRHRGLYNADTDLCLQVLSGGLCTVAFNVFLVAKRWTMQMPGGNTEALYQGDGRLHMARSLERAWPGVVTTKRRYQRAQHVIKGTWRGFDTPLQRRADIDFDALPTIDEYGLELAQVRDEIRSPVVQRLFSDYQRDGQ